ncbi:hypothetical protein Runsl_4805 [Runella slithyformis DSM 19594]|uniref:Uncharacterized protein n=1 Tax=Runella slithyformis (strain ATCC 29530 / DSM 19594 / LMG 11500 / NCIMB 11436 / LSU 4) TaxID=761193 RepID=A0A7U4E897_RUNSL|nr:hypothetical protein Runsl_4805 [Runella slithyformis DSM 19594]
MTSDEYTNDELGDEYTNDELGAGCDYEYNGRTEERLKIHFTFVKSFLFESPILLHFIFTILYFAVSL